MPKLTTIPVDYGIACRIKNKIYFNKALKQHPELFKAILSHEKAHSSGFDSQDVLLDFKFDHLRGKKWEYYKFILKNPKSWTEFLPFWFYEGKLTINPVITGILLLFFAVFVITGGFQ